MSIRSTAKALILKDGKILFNKCNDMYHGEYYSLPGGGQHQYETLPEALVRECLEETGYTVIPIRFAALCEEICMDEGFRRNYPDYAHKMYHIFICELLDVEQKQPTEKDDMQVGCKWVELNSLKNCYILPKIFNENINGIISNTVPIFLGSEYIEYNHG